MEPEIRDERQLRALTGLPQAKFDKLEAAFGQVLAEEQKKRYDAQVAAGQRQRKPGGGQKGKLRTVRQKLLLVLYYLKVYPTFDVLGAQFGLARSKACEHLHQLYPLLVQTMKQLGVFPQRQFANVEEFRAACQDLETLLIDATERPHRRPSEAAEQTALYSGKKRIIPSKTRSSAR